MLRLIFGRPGTGKSTFVYNKIRDNLESGERVLLLVPEQEAVTAERNMSEVCRNTPTLDLEVLNFTRLADRVFRECGGLDTHAADRGAKMIYMWRALSELSDVLKEYRGLTLSDRGLISLMTDSVEQFIQFNITPSAMEEAADELEDGKLKNKLSDLSLIYAAYLELCGTSGEIRTLKLDRALSDNRVFDGYQIYVDSFTGFTASELSILRRLMEQCGDICITLPAPDNYESLNSLVKRLYELSELTGCGHGDSIVLSQAKRYNAPELAYMAENLWDYSKNEPYTSDYSHVRIVSCSDIYSEAEFVATDIARRVREGLSYRDIAIVASQAETYRCVLDTALERQGIPCFMSVREDIRNKPILKLVLGALNILTYNWRTTDVIGYVKTGLAGITPDECDALEEYVMTWSIYGKRWYDEDDWLMNPRGFTDNMTDNDRETLTLVNKIREKAVAPIINLAGVFGVDTDIRHACHGIYEYLVTLGIENLIESDEDIALYNVLISSLEQLHDAAPDMPATPELMCEMLTAVTSGADVGKIPTTMDEVTVGSASRLRVDKIKEVYLIGVNDGEFPRSISEDGIFNDAEKDILASLGIEYAPTTDILSENEMLAFASAAGCASDRVTFVYAKSELSGKALLPSSAEKRVEKLFGIEKPLEYEKMPLKNRIYNYSTSFEYAAANRNTPMGRALLDIYSRDRAFDGRIASLDIPVTQYKNKLSPEIAEKVFPDRMNFSQTRLDKFNNCPFAYHCSNSLYLGEKTRADLSPLDVGSFVHRLLENFFARNSIDLSGLSDELIKSEIDEITLEYINNCCHSASCISKLLLQRFEYLKKTAFLLVKNILAEYNNSLFRPAFYEYSIGLDKGEGLPEDVIKLSDGTEVMLRGRIDRVDVYKKGDDAYVRVVDYKTGKKEFNLNDVEKGLNLQMLLYMYSICKHGNEFKKQIEVEGDIYPAGIMYYIAKVPDINLNEFVDDVEKKLDENISRSGLFLDDDDVISAMDCEKSGRYIPIKYSKGGIDTKNLHTLEQFGELMEKVEKIVCDITETMKSGIADVNPHNFDSNGKCTFCKMLSVCRYRKTKEVCEDGNEMD